jgi:hypothetical protein
LAITLAQQLIDVVHTSGNCITQGQPGFEDGDFHERIDNTTDDETRDEPEWYQHQLGSAPVQLEVAELVADSGSTRP